MNILVVFAHPVEDSYGAALRDAVLRGLGAGTHTIDLLDLYHEGFDPVLSRAERIAYRNVPDNRAGVTTHVDRLTRADALILVFPSWWYGMPAILKGWFDRVWLPGVAFEFGPQAIRPLLDRLKVFGVVTTTGAPGWFTRLYMGNPSRKVLMRGLARLLPARGVSRFWLALYGVDNSTDEQRRRFLAKVEATVAAKVPR